jgi:Ca2+-binding EF-hand superfamily protein
MHGKEMYMDRVFFLKKNLSSFKIDNSGTIDFNEFAGLWKYIEDWKRCFQAFDEDNSGNIDANEMAKALRSFGYNLSENFIRVLVQKFDKYGEWAITNYLRKVRE